MFKYKPKSAKKYFFSIGLGILLLNFFVTFSFFDQTASAVDSSWLYRKQITINHSLVAGNLVNFPILIDITDSDLASKAQPDGDDIMFTTADDSQLSHEIESYNAGHLVAWVIIPALSSSVDTTINMYYGNSEAANQEDPSGVWDSNFMMVQHLSEPSGLTFDSTTINNDGTPVNGVIQGTTGKIDKATDFDGTNDYITIPDSNSLAGYTEGFTASFWIKMDSVSGRQTLLNKWNTGTGQRSWYIEYDSSQTNKLTLFISADGTTYSYWRAPFNPTTDNWNHITIVWSPGQQPLFYINGATVTTTTSTTRTSIYNNAEPLYIGRSYTTGRYLNGVLDEVCLSNSVRSQVWIQTGYNNQLNPSAFVDVSAETPNQPGVSPTVVGRTPVNGGEDIPINTPVQVTFSKPMSTATTQNAFSIVPYVAGSFAWSSGDTVLTFTQNSPLAYNTRYNLTMTVAAEDKSGVNMAAPYRWTFITINQPTYPIVLSTVPVNGATGITVGGKTIQVTFNEPMNTAATEGAFSISPSVPGSFSWLVADNVVANTVLIFTPIAPLTYNTIYEVTISTAAQDKQGDNIVAPYSWSFTTGPNSAPSVVSTNPFAGQLGASNATSVQIAFSEAMDRASTEAAFSIVNALMEQVNGTITWNTANTTMTFTPSINNFRLSMLHTVTISSGAKDMEGAYMSAPYTFSFRTVASSTSPYITTITPNRDAQDVSLIANLRITFNEAMDHASVENSFSINPSIALGQPAFTWSGNQLRVNYTGSLATGTTYTVTMSTGAMDDVSDEHMETAYSWSFKTTAGSPPYVVSTSPLSGATNVKNTLWYVNFSEPMSTSTTYAAFSISPYNPLLNYYHNDSRWVNSSCVEFGMSPLTSSTNYRVTISTNARDNQGENLTAPYTFSFTTGNVGTTSDAWSQKWMATIPSNQGTGESGGLIADITNNIGEEIVYCGKGYVRVLNGITGATIWTYADSAIGWNVQAQMGDIDKDGQMEIVVPLQSPTGILCLNTDNTKTGTDSRSLNWKRTGIGGSSYTSKPLLVDPDGDGYWMIICAPEDVRGFSKYTLWDSAYDTENPDNQEVYNNTYTARIWTFNYDGREINNGLWGTAGGTRAATNGYNPTGSTAARYQWFAWRPCSGGFSMADTDNDGQFEIFQNDRDMYYGDGDYGKGTRAWEWNAITQRLELMWYQPDVLVSSHTPILADINKDGVLDVIVCHQRGGIAVFNSKTGAEMKKDYSIGLPVHYQMVVYDIDHDGNLELIAADGDHPGNSNSRYEIVVFDLFTWKFDARMYVGPCKFGPTVAEVTGDGIMDMVAVSDRGVYIFDGSHDPSVDGTYPVTVVGTNLPYQCMYAVIQDIDDDGKNEIVVTTSGYRVYAYDTPGVTPGQRPRSEVQYYNERRTGVAEYVPPVFYDRTTPIVTAAYPSNEAVNIPVSLSQLQFTIDDLQGDLMDYNITANFPIDTADIIGLAKGDGTYYIDVQGNLAYHTRYSWSVSVTDGIHWNHKTYTFTTPDGTPAGTAPTHTIPMLESDGIGSYEDSTSANLTCTAQNTYDAEGNEVTNIYRWLRNGQTIANLIMPFDTNSLTIAKDYSGYNNNAQIHGATWTSNGVVGGAYSFDGVDDYMMISDGGAGYYNGRIYDSSLGGEGDWNELTIEMWINFEEISIKESARVLMKLPSYEIGLGSVGGSDIDFRRLTAGVWLDNPASGDNAGPPNSEGKANEYWSLRSPSSTLLSPDTWYHVALTYKDGGGIVNSALNLYLNGTLVASSTSLTTRGTIKASSGEPLYIGWYDYFSGMIDEVRILSRSLSAEQILQRYSETKDGLTSSSTLKSKDTMAGDVWSCQVIPNDSSWDGTPRTSAGLTILSGPQVPPVASNVRVVSQQTLSTSRVLSTETVAVIYDYFDENDDPQVFSGSFGTQIRWYQNGTYMPDWDNLLSLSPSLTSAHYQYNCTVTPGDGHIRGTETASTTKPLMNSPPDVTDYSPEYVLSLDHLTLNIGASQTFSFTCQEIDIDPVNIQWQVNSVNATVVQQSNSEFTTGSFTYTFTALGSYTVRVRITDYDPSNGAIYETTTQSWSILIR